MAKYILYGDDDKEDQEMISSILKEVDPSLSVKCVSSGLEVIQFLQQLRDGSEYPCFIILDINMPVLGGLETLKELKHNVSYQKIPIIIFSTSSSKNDKDYALDLGANEFITKPASYESLLQLTQQFAQLCQTVKAIRK